MAKIYVNGKLETKILNKHSVSNSILDDHVAEKVAEILALKKVERAILKIERKKSGK